MTQQTAIAAPTFYPCFKFRDAHAAIAWLERAFGFERQMVVDGEDGSVVHAELRFGSGIFMLGSRKESDPAAPDVADVRSAPFSIYVAVDDADAAYERAHTAGAQITQEPMNTDYGSRDFGARDLEGNHWWFGTYRPAPGDES